MASPSCLVHACTVAQTETSVGPYSLKSATAGQTLVMKRHELRRTRFAGDDDARQRLEVGGPVPEELAVERRDAEDVRDTLDRESGRHSLAGSRRSSASATTSVPPAASVQKIPATELSNEKLGIRRKRAGGSP